MSSTTAVSPGKIILFGEHSVVYGQPAIAVPVTQVVAKATVTDATHNEVLLSAPDLGQDNWLHDVPENHPLAAAVWALWRTLPANTPPPERLHITVTSTIPIASGLGSGAAIAAALIQALAHHIGRDDLAQPAVVSRLTYEVERIHHGAPSGIDNTVVSYQRPVYFVRDLAKTEPQIYTQLLMGRRLSIPAARLDTFSSQQPLHFLIGDTGIKAPTKEAVGDVRQQWQADPKSFENYFAGCGKLAKQGKKAVEAGDMIELGQLMNENHELLKQITVSSPELDRLVQAAQNAGALGAKLSGGGRGGNMIALVQEDELEQGVVKQALLNAGAQKVLRTVLAPKV